MLFRSEQHRALKRWLRFAQSRLPAFVVAASDEPDSSGLYRLQLVIEGLPECISTTVTAGFTPAEAGAWERSANALLGHSQAAQARIWSGFRRAASIKRRALRLSAGPLAPGSLRRTTTGPTNQRSAAVTNVTTAEVGSPRRARRSAW